MKLKLVSVSFVVRNEAETVDLIHELNNLDYGVYSMGTTMRDLTKKEAKEVKEMVPAEILD